MDTAIVVYAPPVSRPKCEKYLEWMWLATCLPSIRSKRTILRWAIPVVTNSIFVSSAFSLLFYPDYYPTQEIVWTFDLALGVVIYNYMYYLQTKWTRAQCYHDVNVRPYIHYISFLFYVLYIIYWLYFAVIQFNDHPGPFLKQLGNLLMSGGWYLFFSTIAASYYFITVKLAQRAQSISAWITSLKANPVSLEQFYIDYNYHYTQTRMLSGYWNFLIFLGILLLGSHIPIDLVSVLYKKYYYDIFGLVVKAISLFWYILCICNLNDYESFLIAYLYKHRLYSYADLADIEKYALYRPLGLDFYGIKINKPFVFKVLLLVFNLIVPTLYALLSNHVFD